MIAEVFVDGKRFKLDPARSLGKGGEADVYDLGDGRAVKVFKSPDHPDYQGLPGEQRAAEERIAIHQRKLRAFPPGLPVEVIAPAALATDRSGKFILGYAMALVASAEPLLRYADPVYRRAGIPSAAVIGLFREILRVVRGLHGANVFVGDFNDLNVLVTADSHPRMIDADSFQFGTFLCTVFTERFVDPLLCDISAKAPRLSKPYDAAADWYAFNALLLQSLLFVGPYGGVYRPMDPAKRIPHGQRPLCRVTVFHPEVQYPKPARAYRVLPDELLHHFHGVFERDERAPFPQALLDRLVFTVCPKCAAEHARVHCPFCSQVTPAAVPRAIAVRGEVSVERIFGTTGLIVHASMEHGELRLVYHEDGAYRREDGVVILRGNLDPSMRFRILGSQTLIGRAGELAVVEATSNPVRLSVDTDGNSPAFDTNGSHRFRISGGRLLRDTPSPWDPGAVETVGDVLANQTRIWVGPAFGLGFYRAGNVSRVFLFDATRRGVNDELRVPPLAGELIDATATLDENRAWLFLALKHAGRVRHLCLVYVRTGQLDASEEAEPGDGSWLGTLRGKCATGGLLLAATDAGIVRVEVQAGTIRKTRDFPDTEEFVDDACQVLVGRRGLCVVRDREVLALQIKQP